MKFQFNSRLRFLLIALIVVIAALYAWFHMDWTGYVQSWGGAMFRATSGAILGWVICRFVLRLHISELPTPEERAVAGIAQALLIGLLAIAVGTGT